MGLHPWERPVWQRSSEWWDRVYTVMDMASEDGNWPTYMADDPCGECGSQFPWHRCHMEVDR